MGVDHHESMHIYLFIYLFIIYFIDYAIIVVPLFSPLNSPPSCPYFPPSFPHLGFCLCVIHISTLASPFPILFSTFSCLFCTFHLCLLFLVHFPPFFPLPADNPPGDLDFCDSAPVLVVCIVFCFCFILVFLGSVVDSCEFVVILLFVFLINFFFIDKPL